MQVDLKKQNQLLKSRIKALQEQICERTCNFLLFPKAHIPNLSLHNTSVQTCKYTQMDGNQICEDVKQLQTRESQIWRNPEKDFSYQRTIKRASHTSLSSAEKHILQNHKPQQFGQTNNGKGIFSFQNKKIPHYTHNTQFQLCSSSGSLNEIQSNFRQNKHFDGLPCSIVEKTYQQSDKDLHNLIAQKYTNQYADKQKISLDNFRNARKNLLRGSAIKNNSNMCQKCSEYMNKLYKVEFLKNKYYSEYIAVKNELQKVKENTSFPSNIQCKSLEFFQLPSLQFDHQELNLKNKANKTISQAVSTKIQELAGLLQQNIQLSSFQKELPEKMLSLQRKIFQFKQKYQLEDDPSYLNRLFQEIQNKDITIKNIHSNYKNFILAIFLHHKDRVTKMTNQFNALSQKFAKQIYQAKTARDKKGKQSQQNLYYSRKTNFRDSGYLKNSLQFSSGTKKRDQTLQKTTNSASQLQKNRQIQKSTFHGDQQHQNSQILQKSNLKPFNIKALNQNYKAQTDFSQFMEKILSLQNQKREFVILQNKKTQTEQIYNFHSVKKADNKIDLSQTRFSDINAARELGTIVYEIFADTACELDDCNVFIPDNMEEVMDMLQHVKKFTRNFDQWQKNKEREISEFQKKFILLLKFLISHYKVTEDELVHEILKLNDQDMEPLVSYVKKYFAKSLDFSQKSQRVSSSFTFGKKSSSCKQSQVQ